MNNIPKCLLGLVVGLTAGYFLFHPNSPLKASGPLVNPPITEPPILDPGPGYAPPATNGLRGGYIQWSTGYRVPMSL